MDRRNTLVSFANKTYSTNHKDTESCIHLSVAHISAHTNCLFDLFRAAHKFSPNKHQNDTQTVAQSVHDSTRVSRKTTICYLYSI